MLTDIALDRWSWVRLVFFDDRFHETHGAQENLMLLASLCQAAGDEVVFVTTGSGPLASRATERGLSVRIVEAPSQLKLFERTAFSGGPRSLLKLVVGIISYNISLAKALGDCRPDVVVSAAIRPTLLLGASRFRFRSPILLYAQNSIPMGSVAAIAGLMSSRICLISDGARPTFPAWFRSVGKNKFVTISSGRDFDRYDRSGAGPHQDREVEVGFPDTSNANRVRVVTVSSITRRKRVDRLIEAMKTIHDEGVDVVLTIVGGTVGPDSERYDAELRDLATGADLQIDFVGWQDNVVLFLHDADLFAMASEHEGLPGVLIEAMAVGLPCVTTRAGSAGQLVEDCKSGASVAVNDHKALVNELRRFCLDRDLRDECGAAGYEAVRGRYGLKQFYDNFELVVAGVHEPLSSRQRARGWVAERGRGGSRD